MPRGGGRRSSSRSSGYRSSFYGGSRVPPRQSPPRQFYSSNHRQAAPKTPIPASLQTMPTRPIVGGGIGSTIFTGMALGAGSEVGHQAVRSMIGGSGYREGNYIERPLDVNLQEIQENGDEQIPQQQSSQGLNIANEKCFDFVKAFNECMKLNQNNTNLCQHAFEELRKCQSMI